MKTKPSFSLKKQWIVGLSLLLIPFLLSFTFVYPVPYAFTAAGKLVPVRELGVKGHVHFVYITSGYTDNLFQRLLLTWEYGKEIDFISLDEADNFSEEALQLDQTYKRATLENAMNAVQSSTIDSQTGTGTSRVEQLMNKAEAYHGDSFGLMVAIGLLEEREGIDFSFGGRYIIAGTGTIEPDQSVGLVGGIKHKLITAEKMGATHFLVPIGKDLSDPILQSNWVEAEETVGNLQLNLKLVPVSSLEEALQFLRNLPRKGEG